MGLSRKLNISEREIELQMKGIIEDFNLECNRISSYMNIKVPTKEMFSSLDHSGEMKKSNSKKIIIDSSSPNIAKPFSVSHLRSTLIGNSIGNIYESEGWEVIRINHLGDWGTQFGKLLSEYKNDPIEIENTKDLLNLYVKFHNRLDTDKSLMDNARDEFSKMEGGDIENLKLWQMFKEISLKEFNDVYNFFGIKYDQTSGESDTRFDIPRKEEELKKRGFLKLSNKSQIVDLSSEGIEIPALLIKKDGSSLYLFRDYITAINRYNKYSFNKMIYEVGSEQSLHFNQLFALLKKTGHTFSDDCEHISHGLYEYKGKKMATRKGQVYFVEDIISKVMQEAENKIRKSNKVFKGTIEEVVKNVALSSIIFNDLKTDREKNVVFDPIKMVEFRGDTGPYIEYSRSRLKSIIIKSDFEESHKKYWRDLGDKERKIARSAICLDLSIGRAVKHNKPHYIAHNLLNLCAEFNRYYDSEKIIGSNNESQKITFIKKICNYIDKGLYCLGLPKIESM